jgi:hypothetical protein
MLRDDPDDPDLLCSSDYDLKPVHFMSTVADCIEWDERSKKLWLSEQGDHVTMNDL